MAGLACVGCSSEKGAPPAAPVDAGTDAQALQCAADEVLAGSGCVKPGVPEDACGEGFVPDGARGCKPVLPADPCPSGQMALPGETACHLVADCGTGTWGSIPLDGTVMFVDASASATGDGSQGKPFKTINDALRAAPNSATIAIAAGAYQEDLSLQKSGQKLWGRCPSMVEIRGAGDPTIFLGAYYTEVHNVAVRGQMAGIGITGARYAVVDHVWVHDVGDAGIAIIDALGTTDAKLGDVLIERSVGSGLVMSGVGVDVSRIVVRDLTLKQANAVGIAAFSSPKTQYGSTVRITSAITERTHHGVVFGGSDVAIDRLFVHDTSPDVEQEATGVTFGTDTGSTKATISHSVVQRSRTAGVVLSGAEVTMDAVTISDVLRESAARPVGYGVSEQSVPKPYVASKLTMTRSRVAQATGVGVTVIDSEATLEAVLVEATRPTDGVADGLLVWSNAAQASARLRGVRIAHCDRAGIATFAASVELSGSRLYCNRIALDGETVGDIAPKLLDQGQNGCGCEPSPLGPCSVVSSNLSPPPRPQ